MVLIYLRHNLSQALIGELFGCSQPTVSRWIARLTPIITTVLTPTADRRAATTRQTRPPAPRRYGSVLSARRRVGAGVTARSPRPSRVSGAARPQATLGSVRSPTCPLSRSGRGFGGA